MDIGLTTFNQYMVFFKGDSRIYAKDKYEIFIESIRVYQRGLKSGILQIDDKLAVKIENLRQEGSLAGLQGRIFGLEGLSKREKEEQGFTMKYLIPFDILNAKIKN